jgi:hypothetical protein
LYNKGESLITEIENYKNALKMLRVRNNGLVQQIAELRNELKSDHNKVEISEVQIE